MESSRRRDRWDRTRWSRFSISGRRKGSFKFRVSSFQSYKGNHGLHRSARIILGGRRKQPRKPRIELGLEKQKATTEQTDRHPVFVPTLSQTMGKDGAPSERTQVPLRWIFLGRSVEH